MAIFFKTDKPEAKRLMKEFDKAFEDYRNRCIEGVTPATEIEGLSFATKLKAHTEIVKLAPLPSQANESPASFDDFITFLKTEETLRDSALNGIRNNKEENVIRDVFTGMGISFVETIGQPKFAPVLSAMFAAAQEKINPSAPRQQIAAAANAPRLPGR